MTASGHKATTISVITVLRDFTFITIRNRQDKFKLNRFFANPNLLPCNSFHPKVLS